jgi:uncharacterized protein (TIGR02246 family)
MRGRALLVAILFALAFPAAAQDTATVQKLADQFAEAFNKNAAAGIGEMYAEDAVLIPPQADMRMGRKDIQAFWTQQAKESEGLTIAVLDVKPLGPDAARAIVRGESTRKGQPPVHVTGRNVVVLQKVGTDWKVTTHIWNHSAGLSQDARGGSDRESRRDGDRDRGRDRDSYGDRDRDRGDYRRDWDGERRGDRDDRRYSDRDRDDYRPRRYQPYEPRGRGDRDY